MSLFDDVVSRATRHSRTSSQVGRAMGVVRSLRDKRVCAHVVGCYPAQKKQGLELVFYTDSALWAQEFQLNAPALLAEWNMRCAQEQPDLVAICLRFKVSTRVHVAPAHDEVVERAYDPAYLPELTAAEIARVEAQVACITDEGLKEKARQAMMASIRWKKSNKA